MRLTWASHMHDGKDTFFIIFLCLGSFLTMRLLVEIHNTCCSCTMNDARKCVAVVVTGKKINVTFPVPQAWQEN